jgi:HlyD family secretion protein
VRNNATTIQNVVTYDAVIDVDNADLALRPTMTASMTFVYATRSSWLARQSQTRCSGPGAIR